MFTFGCSCSIGPLLSLSLTIWFVRNPMSMILWTFTVLPRFGTRRIGTMMSQTLLWKVSPTHSTSENRSVDISDMYIYILVICMSIYIYIYYVDMIEKFHVFFTITTSYPHRCTLQTHWMCMLSQLPLPRRLPSLQSFGGKESMGTFQGDRSSSPQVPSVLIMKANGFLDLIFSRYLFKCSANCFWRE